MSLDISLYATEKTKKHCHHCGNDYEEYETVYDCNITHNLGTMASEAGIYEALWRPYEISCRLARDIVPVLEAGYNKLIADPEHFRQFNAKNGWGMYEHFVPFVKNYLDACKENPDSEISVSG